MKKQRAMQPVDERFWSKVNKDTESGCWEWTSSLRGNGYGAFFTHLISGERKQYAAHRFSWMLTNGEIPNGLWVLHKCDNRLCVNPDHLFLGDRVANMRDCATKGRVCTVGQAKKTHCLKGHEFTEENTKLNSKGHRLCLQCAKDNIPRHNERSKLRMRKVRAESKAAAIRSGK